MNSLREDLANLVKEYLDGADAIEQRVTTTMPNEQAALMRERVAVQRQCARHMRDLLSRDPETPSVAADNRSEWWATYRAALTGLCAWSGRDGSGASQAMGTEDAHSFAAKAADLAHGKRDR